MAIDIFKQFQSDEEGRAFLTKSIEIDPTQLQTAFYDLPGEVAYWNSQHADSLRDYYRAKLEAKQVSAKVDLDIRAKAKLAGDKKTETAVAAELECHPDVLQSKLNEIEAEVEMVRLRGICDAMRAKREMLIQLGMQQQFEMRSDPAVRKLYQTPSSAFHNQEER